MPLSSYHRARRSSSNRTEIFGTKNKRGYPVRYPWQKAVFEALMEVRPQYLVGRINKAKLRIATRLSNPPEPDFEESVALHDALRALRFAAPGSETQRIEI